MKVIPNRVHYIWYLRINFNNTRNAVLTPISIDLRNCDPRVMIRIVASRSIDCCLEVQSGKTNVYRICIFCFSSGYAAWKRKNKTARRRCKWTKCLPTECFCFSKLAQQIHQVSLNVSLQHCAMIKTTHLTRPVKRSLTYVMV